MAGGRFARTVTAMDRLLPWLRQSGFVYVGIALALAALAWRVSWGGDPGQPGPAASEATPLEITQPRDTGSLVVHVAGAVRRPGVYRVARGARVQAAVKEAGGPGENANVAAVNLAAQLQDGQQVVVPERISTASPGAAPSGGTGPISLSSATVQQLDELDGVGPTLAARIVEWRQANGGFAAVEQLLEVPGIGEGRLAAIREKVTP